jgi:hypothetical protein
MRAKQKRPKSSTDNRLSIEKYVDECKDRLGLRDWRIVYKVAEEPAKDAEADIMPHHGKVAFLRVNKQFFTFSPSYQRNIICHELIHVLFARQDDVIHSVEDVLAPCTYALFEKNFVEANENLVQDLANLLENLLPLPNWS